MGGDQPNSSARDLAARSAGEEGIIRVAIQKETPEPRLPVEIIPPDSINKFLPEQRAIPNAAAPPANSAQSQAPAQSTSPPQLNVPANLPPPLQSLLSNSLVDLQFVTASLGYGVTQPGEILSTNDGGKT